MSELYLTLAKKAIASLTFFGVLTTPFIALAKEPNDPWFDYQRSFYTQIEATKAWEYTTGSSNVVVAVIDTGADTWHDDLSPNIWKNPKEIADNNLDDDHNGYTDDINGWNFVEDTSDVRTSVFNSKDDAEAVRHGTVIAGLVGEVGDNNRNGAGLNWKISIMPLRAIDSVGTGSYSDLIKAVQYAMDNGADIISMSFTGPYDNATLKSVLYQAYQRGIVVVAAAGNHKADVNGDLDKKIAFPACYDVRAAENWVLTVGSVGLDDVLSSFSNYGSCVDLTAPGEGIYSIERYAPQYGYTSEFGGEWRGTSFAAPLVAGAAALIKAYRPDWGADRIIPAIMNSLDSVEAKNPGQQGKMGQGRLNIGRALASIPAPQVVIAPTLPQDSLYRISSNNRIDRFDTATNEQERVASLGGDARFISLAATPGNDTVAVLLRRDKFYFLQTISSAGNFLSEVSLPITYGVNWQVKKVRFLADGQRVVVEQYDTKRRVTTFTIFTLDGTKTGRFEAAGVVSGWDTGKITNVVSFAQPVKNALLVTDVNLDTSTKQRYTLKVKGGIDDMRYGPVLSGGEQAVLLVRNGNDVSRYTVSVATQSFRKDFVGEADVKDPWRIRLVSFSSGIYNILAYKKTGTFAITDHQGIVVGTVKLPIDSSGIVY